MNAVIAVVVGGVVSLMAVLGGAAALSNTSAGVSQEDLYTYSDE